MNFDHVLLIGFGGPTKSEEIGPFLQNVTRGIPIPGWFFIKPARESARAKEALAIPEERLREVEHHYQAVGGKSPYNEWAFRLADQLHEKLHLPVFVGFRNWHPLLKETLAEISQKGLKRGIGVILAPHRSDASYGKYIRNVEEANFPGAGKIEYQYLNAWYDNPGFIDAQAEQIQKILKDRSIPMIFSAHSIPVEMAEKSKYAEEVKTSSELVAKKLGLSNWQVAWQSRSGSPKQPWLEPDVLSVIRDRKAKGEKQVMLVPIGFLCDNVEVLYDLDIEAKQEAEKLGMKYFRASTVTDHPKFVGMLAKLIHDTR